MNKGYQIGKCLIDATVIGTLQTLMLVESGAFFTIGSTLTMIPVKTNSYNDWKLFRLAVQSVLWQFSLLFEESVLVTNSS